MTETATREDLEERLKDSPGCESAKGPCSNPVAWQWHTFCCDYRILCCDVHKRMHAEEMQYISALSRVLHNGKILCFCCKIRIDANQWDEYIPV